jgi:xylulokinase
MYLMGIDVGTSGVKVIILSEKGSLISEKTSSYPIHSPFPSWFEQNPEDWWNATVRCIREILSSASIDPLEIRGIGLSGMYHGLVLLDRDCNVIRPCILWNDQRTALQSEYLSNKIGGERLLRIAATSCAPYFTACKLIWVRDNEPDNYEKIYKCMLPKDYVRFRLTGEFVTDMTDASGTLFLNIHERKWSSEMMEVMEVDKDILPDLVESPEISGKTSRKAFEETGLPSGIPVAGGGGDQAAAAIGNGIVDEGVATYSIGTSGVIYAATNEIKYDPEGRVNSFCHAAPGKWSVLAVINSAAGSYQWYLDNFSDWAKAEAKQTGESVYAILERNASRIPEGSDKLFFLPYLAGERHPHTNTNARGVFFGLHAGHTNDHIVRSILEGVSFCFRDCLDVMRELEISIDEIRATGGGAKSKFWLEMLANTSGEPIVTMASDEGGAAFGAAILGGVSAGVFENVQEACSNLVHTGAKVIPQNDRVEKYNKYFKFFQSLYPLLKPSYEELARL